MRFVFYSLTHFINFKTTTTFTFGLAILLAAYSHAQDNPDIDRCLVQEIQTSENSRTIEEIKIFCEEQSNVEDNSESEATATADKSYRLYRLALTPHRSNFLLPIAYNRYPNSIPFASELENGKINNTEIEFQISLKVQLFENVFGNNGDIFVAYTGQSWWQSYNTDLSSPFRETNYEPEAFISFDTQWNFLNWNIHQLTGGIIHESNGRSLPQSRSWNRLYLNIKAENDHWFFQFKPWYRIPENEKDQPGDASGDDNPDINFYMGNFELTTGYGFDEHRIALMVRNNLRSESRGALQLNWSFPLKFTNNVRGYLQIFDGYGESLIDYDERVQRFSLGFVFTE